MKIQIFVRDPDGKSKIIFHRNEAFNWNVKSESDEMLSEFRNWIIVSPQYLLVCTQSLLLNEAKGKSIRISV